MNKKILFLILSGILVLPATAIGQLRACPVSGPCVTSINPMIHSVEMTAGLVFGCIAVVCFVVAGILFLTAGGQPEKIATARAAVIWGIVGVIVGILAFSIIAIIVRIIS